MKRVVILALAAATLSACGAREGLKPVQGASLPAKPYGAAAQPDAAALLNAQPQTRPARSDDLIESSNKRRSDSFDLPPPN